MILYQPKPIKWQINEYLHHVGVSPFTAYKIFFDENEREYTCKYCHHMRQEVGFKSGKSLLELIEWVEQTHYPSQVKKYFNEIKLEKVEKGQ